MNRRAFLSVLGAGPWLISEVYGDVRHKVPHIGFLGRVTPNFREKEGFQQGLRELGYLEGKNILIEWRNTLGHEDELRPLAVKLVQTDPDVIVTFSTPATRAVLEATKIIPVVFVGDPCNGVSDELGKAGEADRYRRVPTLERAWG